MWHKAENNVNLVRIELVTPNVDVLRQLLLYVSLIFTISIEDIQRRMSLYITYLFFFKSVILVSYLENRLEQRIISAEKQVLIRCFHELPVGY